MKQFILTIAAAIVVSLLFASCSEKSPADYKEELENLQQEYILLKSENKEDEAEQIRIKINEKVKEILIRYLEDPEFARQSLELDNEQPESTE